MTTDILREMVAGPIPRHSDDRELLRLFADRLWASFCEDMAAQYKRGVDEGERHSVERSDSGICDTLRTISTECQYAMERISDESDYGRMYLGRVRNIARAALANGGQEEKEKVNPMSEHGNAAAMRKALLKASDVLTEAAHHNLTEEYVDECLAIIHAALAEPPRNCDVHRTVEEAFSACHADRGYISDSAAERRSTISFMLSGAQETAKAEQFTPDSAQETEKIEHPGNAAAMREALEEMVLWMRRVMHSAWFIDADFRDTAECKSALDKASAALSAPPRNCDRPECATRDGAYNTWYRETWKMSRGDFPDWSDWLFAPAEGGDHA